MPFSPCLGLRLNILCGLRFTSYHFESNFNLNPKHGENGKGAHPSNNGQKVSILMCCKEEATRLLYKAIGEDPKTLYYFDKQCSQYIEFKRESENIYHGFHLDAEDERRVPRHIKTIIDKLC